MQTRQGPNLRRRPLRAICIYIYLFTPHRSRHAWYLKWISLLLLIGGGDPKNALYRRHADAMSVGYSSENQRIERVVRGSSVALIWI